MFARIWIIGWAIFATSNSEVYKIETETSSSRQPFLDEIFKNITDTTPSSKRLSQWSEWSDWSTCTRTCGGGVMSQTRTCMEPSENSINSSSKQQLKRKKKRSTKNRCVGDSKRTKICNGKICPPGTKDFRTVQCENYNKNAFAGIYYAWEAYYDDRNQCALNCRPFGYKFYATLNRTVTDGTSCTLHAEDNAVCLEGKCQYVGCDGVVGGRRFDVCGICGGNNSTCRLISGLFTRPHLITGYNYITDIPQNGCNLTILEVKRSTNLFALRYKNGTYILNGDWQSNPPGTYNGAGTQFVYAKENGNSGQSISSLGPTLQPLEFLLLYRQTNPGIKYEYRVAMPNVFRESAPPTSALSPQKHSYQNDALESHQYEDSERRKKYNSNAGNQFVESSAEFQGAINDEETRPKSKANKKKKFLWKITGYTPCTKTCGGGTQSPIYSCVKEVNQQHVVNEKRCVGLDKPEKAVIRCSIKPCPAMWVVGDWGHCSVTCGEGEETREILCKQEISPTVTMTVSEEACLTTALPNLLRTRPCFRKPCPDGTATSEKPYWKTGTWSTCSTRCGVGVRTRTVQCMAESEDECSSDERPPNEMACDMGPCTGQGNNVWLTTEWSQQCSETCGVGTQSRRVICSAASQQESICDKTTKPETSRNCSSASQCGGRWFSGPWSKCSVECSWGKQTRTAICMAYSMETKSYIVISDSHCPEKEKPSLEQACFDKACNSQWFAASWSDCTRTCDSGIQRREVRCVNEDLKPSIDCKEEEKPATRRSCNSQKCPIYSSAKEGNPYLQGMQTETASQTLVDGSLKHLIGNADCKDQLNNCHLVTQARLCNYKYYKTFCCASCYSLYYTTTNSTITSANN